MACHPLGPFGLFIRSIGSMVRTSVVKALLTIPSSTSHSMSLLTIRVGSSPSNKPVRYTSGRTIQLGPSVICTRSFTVMTHDLAIIIPCSCVAFPAGSGGISDGTGSPDPALIAFAAVLVVQLVLSGLFRLVFVVLLTCLSTSVPSGVGSPDVRDPSPSWCIGISLTACIGSSLILLMSLGVPGGPSTRSSPIVGLMNLDDSLLCWSPTRNILQQ